MQPSVALGQRGYDRNGAGGEDLESLYVSQALTTAKEECLGVDVVMLAAIEDKLPIME